jgi:hypothetical protein
MMPEPMRADRDSALAAAPGGHLAAAVGGQRPPVVNSQPQLRPVRLGVPGPDAQVAVNAAGGLMADPDDPRLAALAANHDLPVLQVNVTALAVTVSRGATWTA